MSRRDAPDALQATDPAASASVHASAGTGKTWLLTTRIIRLLLAGARPDGILAVTFTRKAAAEMQQRVTERLRELTLAEPAELDALLQQCGIRVEEASRRRARLLYEELLFHPYPLRTTTFHAFCQELLQRFPLEAGVTPGFTIGESTGLLEQAAHDALVAQTAQAPDGPVARALDELVERCGGLANAGTALRSFLAQRSDWWAWVQGRPDALQHAGERLTALLGREAATDPLPGFPATALRDRLQAFAGLLARHATQTNLRHAEDIATALADGVTPAACLEGITPVFFKTSGGTRARKSSGALRKALGPADEARLLELDTAISTELLEIRDRLARHNTLRTGQAWYRAGMELLAHYQRIKREQRVLDFADLEWRACELLNRSEHASWVQYKLDARIEHLLVDEFQDTNPTQWRLLLPLLQELAAGDDRGRSVFLVGDVKQSIYGFRRAKPALMNEASDWLQTNLGAGDYPLDASRRSAQAIMDGVNAVFGTAARQALLGDFHHHDTHLADLYGRVEILPLCAAQPAAVESGESADLRNPLRSPRIVREHEGYRNEGRMIAEKIRELIDARTPVADGGGHRPVHYGDIMLLLRQRTHAGSYENALRDHGIPYLSAGRSLLLETIEVRDLEALLNLLISPYDNLALAQVLRSPLFNLDSEALLPLAAMQEGTWYERLAVLAARGEAPWEAAWRMLETWRGLAGRVPVHDLLDRIYHEADVMRRYLAACPATLQPRVRAGLTRFIELALEVDHGRYPSLPRFLEQLARLRQTDRDQPEEGTPEDTDGRRVRLLTVHGSKGLESPVVFIADAAVSPPARSAWTALVDWPPGADRPAQFLLTGGRAVRDRASQQLIEAQAQEAHREDANLLYVAMTRARQYLFVSGTAAARNRDNGWYGLISAAAGDWPTNTAGNPVIESATPPQPSDRPEPACAPPALDPRLSAPIEVPASSRRIAPSRTAQAGTREDGDADGRERGQTIHLMLERLAQQPEADHETLYRSVAGALARDPGEPELLDWWQEALRTCRAAEFAELFEPDRYEQAFSEVPVQYLEGDHLVYGIIDRLVLLPGRVLVVDYKTHRNATPATIPALAGQYREQVRLYARAAARLWPERKVQAALLFTACGILHMTG